MSASSVLLIVMLQVCSGLLFGLQTGSVASIIVFTAELHNCTAFVSPSSCAASPNACVWRSDNVSAQCLFHDYAAVNCTAHSRTNASACGRASPQCVWEHVDSECHHAAGFAPLEQGLLASSLIVGAFVGTFVSAAVARRRGRLSALRWLVAVPSLAGIVLEAVFWQEGVFAALVAVRVALLGLAIGAVSVAAPLLTAESVQPELRTVCGALFQVFVTTGGFISSLLLFAVTIDYSTLTTTSSSSSAMLLARFHAFFGVVFVDAVVLAVLAFAFLEESPVWLAEQRQHALAQRAVDGDEHSAAAAAAERLPLVNRATTDSERGQDGFSESSFAAGDQHDVAPWPLWRVVLMSFVLAMDLQMGVNAVLNFAPTTVLPAMGLDPVKGNLVLMTIFWLTTLLTFVVASRVTPFRAFAWSTALLSVSCLLVGLAVEPSLALSKATSLALGITGLSAFAAVFHAGAGPFFFVISSTNVGFPAAQVQLGCTLSQSFQFLLNIVVNFGTPLFIKAASGPGGDQSKGLAVLYFVFAALNAVGCGLFAVLAPKPAVKDDSSR